jgi:AraC-like DNA-binding protein
MDANYLLNGINSYNVNIALDNGILATFEKFLLQSQPLLSRVFRFIETNYQRSISLREVAKAVGRSPAYLTDLVKRETGKTVLNWIIERRMAEARRLLLETQQSVEQISEAVGYFDRRHFSRQFLKFHNATPQTWRRVNQTKSISMWQINPQNSNLSNSSEQKMTSVTAIEIERLQACVEEIAAILNKNSATGEELVLGAENSFVTKTGDGSIKITLVSTSY